MAAVTQQQGSRIPQPGEALILADGRRFVLCEAGGGVRGWWFKAESREDDGTLQGNLQLEWDTAAGAWRPAGSRPSIPASPSPSQMMGRAPRTRQKQAD